jgi:outer membrane biosynthesis protein TonB
MTSEKRFKQKDAELGIFDAFHAGFVVPLAKFLDGEEEAEQAEEEAEQAEEAVAEVETPKPAKPKPKPKEEPTPTQEEESEVADDNDATE